MAVSACPRRSIFEEYVAEAGLGDRLRFYAGDFFTDPLPAADVLIMGYILHDWDLEGKRALLAKAAMFDSLGVTVHLVGDVAI